MRTRVTSGLSRAALIVAVSSLTAACSSDVSRFNGGSFSQPVATAQSRAVPDDIIPAPTGSVDTAPLPAIGSGDRGLTTGSIIDRAGSSSMNATPAVRQMAMGRTMGEQGPVVRNGWTPVGGTTIRAGTNDTVETLSRRFGVPASAIAQANGFSQGQALSAGQSVVIPTYSLAQAQTTVPQRPQAPRASEPSARPSEPAPRRAVSAEAAATAPVPQSRMAWSAGAQPAASAQRASAPAAVRRPASHTVAMGESLASIATRYGMSRQELAATNNLSLDRPIQIGQVLRLAPAAAPASQSARTAPADRREQAQRTVATTQATPAGRAADRTTTATIANGTRQAQAASQAGPSSTPAVRAQAQPAPRPRATPAVAASANDEAEEAAPRVVQARAEDPASRETAAGQSQPSFRWPVRGRVVSNFRAGSSDGIRIAVPEGTAVKAADDGVVAYAGNELRGYGNLVLVRHANGYVTAYAHNSEIMVRRGEQVRRGQTISKAGQTGTVSSPQLHFEIRRGASPVDPMSFLASN